MAVVKMINTQKQTEYQKWLHTALAKRGWDTADLARHIGRDYNYVWRIAVGDPEKYPNARRPGIKLAMQIGEALGEIEESLRAAGHDVPLPRQNIGRGEIKPDALLAFGVEVDATPYLYSLRNVQGASAGIELERMPDVNAPGEDYTYGSWLTRAIRVVGNCMEPVLQDGDVALILPPEAVVDGCYVTATVDIVNNVCKRIRIPEGQPSYLEPVNGEGQIAEDRFVVSGVVANRIMPLLPPTLAFPKKVT